MYDHIGLRVKDLEASVRFYRAALVSLGIMLHTRDTESASFGPTGEPSLWLYLAKTVATSGVHLAFRTAERSAVDRFHASGLQAGGRDHGAPGVRTGYGPSYYAAFLLDPDGNNIEALCLR